MSDDYNFLNIHGATASEILNAVVAAYLEAVYFTDTGDGDQPSSDVDLAPESVFKAQADCADFLHQCEISGLLASYAMAGRTWDSFGHDIWLTRNHHGAGFWDRGLRRLGEKLTEIAHAMGECNAYAGDDGKLYLS